MKEYFRVDARVPAELEPDFRMILTVRQETLTRWVIRKIREDIDACDLLPGKASVTQQQPAASADDRKEDLNRAIDHGVDGGSDPVVPGNLG